MKIRALLVVSLVALSSCPNFDQLERDAICRNTPPACGDLGGGAGGGLGGGTGGGAIGGGGGVVGGGGGSSPSDAFTDDGGLQVMAVARAASASESRGLDALGTSISWSSTLGCDGQLDGGVGSHGCTRSYSVTGTQVKLINPGLISYADAPLSVAVGPTAKASLDVVGGGSTSLNLSVDPQDGRSMGGIFGPLDAVGPWSGSVVWVGPGKQFVAAFPAAQRAGLTLWGYDFDLLDGGRLEDPSPVSACDVRVDDGAGARQPDGSPVGAAFFALALTPSCGDAGIALVRAGTDGVPSFPLPPLDVPSLRMASAPGTLWAASPGADGGSELRRFEVSSAGVLTAAGAPWVLAGAWRQADVAADDEGRPYLLGDGTGLAEDGGTRRAVWLASFELDGGPRFRLPLPGTQSARATALAWSSRGMAISGDCDAGSSDGVCVAGEGAFLTIVRVPR